MPTVDDVQFDTTGWKPYETGENRVIWINAAGDTLTKRFNPEPPKMPGLFRTDELRQYYQQQIAAINGAILSVDLLQNKGTAVSKLLFKIPQADQSFGYAGTFTIAYRNFSYFVRMQVVERPGDDNRMKRSLEVLKSSHPAEADISRLWFGEETVEVNNSARRCHADDEIWDCEFPQHPLSRLRAELSRLFLTIQISRDVKNSAPHYA